MERKNRMANKCKIKMEKVNGGRQAFTTLRALFRKKQELFTQPHVHGPQLNMRYMYHKPLR